jgi:G:T-mismatch repair DNA endonuclease (very short patch repair protein)
MEKMLLDLWTPIVVWECTLREPHALDELFWQIVGNR